jgi:excinuclease UvrABC nuclease subunit
MLQNTTQASGVYALFKQGVRWVYIGESGDIQSRLLGHLSGDNQCINQQAPDGFQFEYWASDRRVARQNELIRALRPVCNQPLG